MVNTGIYQILHKESGKRYIGSSKNIKNRLAEHKSGLRHSRHPNDYLQKAFNKYGEDAFEFKQIVECLQQDLELYEQLIIDGYKSNQRDFGYNLRKVASSNAGMMTKGNTYKVGDTYNRLTIVAPLELNEFGSRYWLCKCSCGNEARVEAGQLRNGHTKSCGCYNLENLRQRNKDPVGSKFGRLTLIEHLYTNHRRKRVGLFKCDCGNQHTAVITEARSGHVSSCGCIRKEIQHAWLKEQHKKGPWNKKAKAV